MGFFSRKKEERAENGFVQTDDALLRALLGSGEITRDAALQIPTIGGAIDLIGNIVASTPIKLYREQDGKAEEVKGDPRIRILNDDPGDTLNASDFWRAMVRDYYLGKGAYAYIQKSRGRITALRYVDEARVQILTNNRAIDKDFDILVDGKRYLPYEFFIFLRNSKDGAQGTPITKENSRIIDVAIESLMFERNLVKKGGNKKGFLQSKKKLTAEAMKTLRTAFRALYNNAEENVVVLNDDIDFKESSNTSVEMQLNENKRTNAEEFAKVLHIPPDVIAGKASESDISSVARLAAIPLMTQIQCALNRCLLLEREKANMYYAFDTKELLKGDMRTRFEAYRTALDANFMQIDEVRFAEDLEPLGLNWIKLGLKDVLYDPKNHTVFTPNTGKTGGFEAEPGKEVMESED